MITKTLTGAEFFDADYGGVFRGRSWLACGRKGTGKTLLGLQFIRQGLLQNERCLMLSAMQAADISICAATMNLPLSESLEAGNLILLEYNDFIPGRDTEQNITLPPEGFAELKEIVLANAIQRIVLDTVLPWTAIRDQNLLHSHVFSFVRAFERLGTTNLLTLPKPVSPLAFRLKNAIEDVVPVSIFLSPTPQKNVFSWQVNKYLGERKAPTPVAYVISPSDGLCRLTEGTQPPTPPVFSPESTPAPESAPTPGPRTGLFSRMLTVSENDAPKTSRPTPPQPSASKESPEDASNGEIRFSAAWKPNLDDKIPEGSA